MAFHPPEMVLAELVASIVVVLTATALALLRFDVVDKLAAALKERRRRGDAAEQARRNVSKIQKQLDRMEAKQDIQSEQLSRLADDFDDMEAQVQKGFRTVALLHANDPLVDNEVLRHRLGISGLDDDLFKRGGVDVEDEEEEERGGDWNADDLHGD